VHTCVLNGVEVQSNSGYLGNQQGYEPQRWGLPGNSYQPGMVSLPADYVEVFQ
jgi:hypothetical protein